MTFNKTLDQNRATDLLVSDAEHIMLYGGSRSGKTFLLVYAIFLRAIKEKGSRHTILRYRFSHAKQSLVYDTIPKVIEICFPSLHPVDKFLNKSDWFYKLPNGSEVWIGGLDDKERTEKILGNEYSTIYFNECSQISYASLTKVRTRLAQKTSLVNKFYYDENPPSRGHWTYKEFIEKINPVTKKSLKCSNYVSMQLNPDGNKENIASNYLDLLADLPDAEKARFLFGEFGEAVSGAVYGEELATAHRETRITSVPYDKQYEVHTWWDIGIGDSTAIWFVQYAGVELRIIDFLQENGKGSDYYWTELKKKPYSYGRHNLPHDAGNKQFTLGGKSISMQFKQMGMSNIVHKRTKSLTNDIYAAKLLFNKCVFDAEKCSEGIECLEAYHYEYDEKKGTNKDTPEHDWSSHASDAFRYLAVGYYDYMGEAPKLHKKEGEMVFADVFHFIQQDRQEEFDRL